MASANATTPNVGNIQELSPSALASLPAKTLRSHLKGYSLSAAGSKVMMANRLYQFLHPVGQPANNPSSTPQNTVAPTTTIETASTSVPTINARQIIEQLSTRLQQANSAMSTTIQNNPSNNSPYAQNDTLDVDEIPRG